VSPTREQSAKRAKSTLRKRNRSESDGDVSPTREQIFWRDDRPSTAGSSGTDMRPGKQVVWKSSEQLKSLEDLDVSHHVTQVVKNSCIRRS
jgi:hypothetical protein